MSPFDEVERRYTTASCRQKGLPRFGVITSPTEKSHADPWSASPPNQWSTTTLQAALQTLALIIRQTCQSTDDSRPLDGMLFDRLSSRK